MLRSFSPRTDPTLSFFLTVLVCLLGLGGFVCLAKPAAADDIPEGVDLFKSPGPNFFQLVVPQGFFFTGSSDIDQTVNLVGEPLQQWRGDLIGGVDTIVLRDPATLACGGTANDIQIELVALNLVSAQPISVDGQLWSVRACVSDNSTSDGTMDITQVCDEGGTFSSTLTVHPKLVFTRLGDGETRVMDPAPEKIFVTTDVAWVHDPMEIDARLVGPGIQVDGNCDGVQSNDPVLPVGTSNFFPGIEANPCTMCNDTVVVDNEIRLVPHQQGMPPDPAAAQHQARIALFVITEIPTLFPGGLVLVALLLALAGAWVLYRRRRVEG